MTYRLESVSYSFGAPILKDISLDISAGKFIGIAGPNGSGKTTLLRLLSGFYTPQTGQVLLNGQAISAQKPKDRAKKIAVVTQINAVNPRFKVSEMIDLGRAPYHYWFWQKQNSAEKALIEKITAELKLTNLLERRLDTLSGGERQRTIIARALVQDTAVLLLDEPVNHLDIHHQLEILRYLKRLSECGRTIIAVLHDLRLVRQFCDHLLVLDKGKVIAGTPEEHKRSGLLARVFELPEDSEFLC